MSQTTMIAIASDGQLAVLYVGDDPDGIKRAWENCGKILGILPTEGRTGPKETKDTQLVRDHQLNTVNTMCGRNGRH